MRILYVVTGAAFGGAPQHVLHLSKSMLDQGHTVGIVAAPEPRLMREAESLGIEFFPNRHFVSPLLNYHDPAAVIPVYRAIRNFRPNLIHSHSFKAGIVSRLCAVITRTPVVYTVHGWSFEERRAWWTPSVVRQLEKLAARVTARIICLSEVDRSLALKRNIGRQNQYSTIRNGVPDHRSRTNERSEADGQAVGRDQTVLIVARLAPPKDFDTLLRAIHASGAPQTVIVGDGPLAPQIEEQIRELGMDDHVSLLGESSDVPDLMANAQIFVLSSYKEGQPLAVIEAMMAGLPVVASNVGALSELVEDGQTGFLTAPRDVAAMAVAISQLLSDDALRSRMGQSAREKALAEFGVDRMCSETLGVYESVW